MRVYLTSVDLPQLLWASRVSESASQLQGKPAPFASSHISPSHWVSRLSAWHGLQIYCPLSQRIKRKISLMWPTDDACTTSNGFRRKQGFLLVIAMMKSNMSDRTRELREECWLGSSTSGYQRWQKQWLAKMILHEASPPRNLLRPWPSFTKTHSWSSSLAFSYRRDHHSTSITNLTNKKLRDKIFLFDFVSTFVLLHVN